MAASESTSRHIPDDPVVLNLRWPSSVKYSHLPSISSPQQDSTGEITARISPSGVATTTGETTERLNDTDPAYAASPVEGAQIRLLRIHAGLEQDLIHAEFLVPSMSNRPKYEAVSYLWADENDDSSRCKKVFLGRFWDVCFITSTCETALRQLRCEDSERLIWIDLICINQDDVNERSHQIPLMRDIYSHAEHVLAFVGKSSENNDHVMRLMTYASKYLSASEKMAFRRFFNQRYFQRVWVVQEVVLSTSLKIYCGTSQPVTYVKDDPIWETLLSENLAPAWMELMKKEHRFPAVDFIVPLTTAALCRSTDARDKVFGLFGLMRDPEVALIEPDYSLSAREVFIGMAAFFVQNCGLFSRVLDYVVHESAHLKLPSWVPDWTYKPPSIGAYQIAQAILGLDHNYEHRYKQHRLVKGFLPRRGTFLIDRSTAHLRVQGVRLCDFSQHEISLQTALGRNVFIWQRDPPEGPMIFIPSRDIPMDSKYSVFYIRGSREFVVLTDCEHGSFSCVSSCSILSRTAEPAMSARDTIEVVASAADPTISQEEYTIYMDYNLRKQSLFFDTWEVWKRHEMLSSWIYQDKGKLSAVASTIKYASLTTDEADQLLRLLTSLLGHYEITLRHNQLDILPESMKWSPRALEGSAYIFTPYDSNLDSWRQQGLPLAEFPSGLSKHEFQEGRPLLKELICWARVHGHLSNYVLGDLRTRENEEPSDQRGLPGRDWLVWLTDSDMELRRAIMSHKILNELFPGIDRPGNRTHKIVLVILHYLESLHDTKTPSPLRSTMKSILYDFQSRGLLWKWNSYKHNDRSMAEKQGLFYDWSIEVAKERAWRSLGVVDPAPFVSRIVDIV